LVKFKVERPQKLNNQTVWGSIKKSFGKGGNHVRKKKERRKGTKKKMTAKENWGGIIVTLDWHERTGGVVGGTGED